MRSRTFRTGSRGGAAALGPLEGSIMDIMWDRGIPTTVAEMQAALEAKGRAVSYSATKAVMLNLTKKRLLAKRSAGRSNVFRATQTRQQFDTGLVDNVLSSLLKHYRAPLLTRLVDELIADDATIAEFEKLLDQRRKKRSGR
jgi:predicted transcriptional regulator